ncbi:MAG TPA: hypothetical protein DDW80_05625 [Desulfovibrio sp.]|nr:hypothetical protein [Desulfovibrio sp.]
MSRARPTPAARARSVPRQATLRVSSRGGRVASNMGPARGGLSPSRPEPPGRVQRPGQAEDHHRGQGMPGEQAQARDEQEEGRGPGPELAGLEPAEKGVAHEHVQDEEHARAQKQQQDDVHGVLHGPSLIKDRARGSTGRPCRKTPAGTRNLGPAWAYIFVGLPGPGLHFCGPRKGKHCHGKARKSDSDSFLSILCAMRRVRSIASRNAENKCQFKDEARKKMIAAGTSDAITPVSCPCSGWPWTTTLQQGGRIMQTSARNTFSGKVANIKIGMVLSEVELTTPGGQTIVSVITNESREALKVEKGKAMKAIVKAPWVILAKPETLPATSARNDFLGQITKITKGQVACEVVAKLKDGTVMCALITGGSAEGMGLKVGDPIRLLVKSFSVILVDE